MIHRVYYPPGSKVYALFFDGRMSRKRFTRLMMCFGVQRNTVDKLAKIAVRCKGSYARYYADFAWAVVRKLYLTNFVDDTALEAAFEQKARYMDDGS